MNVFLEIVSEYGSVIIIAFGLIMLGFVIANASKLFNQKKKIEGELNRKTKKRKYDIKNQELIEEEKEEKAAQETIGDCEKEFNKLYSVYGILEQLVQLFPLLGIFGTVCGLIQMSGALEGQEMMDALGTALWTTLWGLVGSIILKFILAVFSFKAIFEIEAMLEGYYQDVNYSIAMEKVTRELNRIGE